MEKSMRVLSLSFVLMLSACDGNSTNFNQSVQLGEKTFIGNCAVCHGNKAQGLADDWQKPLPDGTYPPPPLNGTAHAWHHSPGFLLRTINQGSASKGGAMPEFKNKLNDKEKQAVIDYLYSLWPDKIKQHYDKRFK